MFKDLIKYLRRQINQDYIDHEIREKNERFQRIIGQIMLYNIGHKKDTDFRIREQEMNQLVECL